MVTATKKAKQKFRNYTRYLGFTLDTYRDAVSFANKVVYGERQTIEALPSSKIKNQSCRESNSCYLNKHMPQ